MEESKMEPIIQIQPQQLKPTGAASATARAASDGDQTVTDIVRNAAQAVRVQVEDRSAEIIDRTKQQVSAAYDQANKSASDQYRKTVDYGLENPGKTTLMVFGVGVGLGALLVSCLGFLRDRRN
jgi:hypothetical protein